jgi:hypothetical protein
MFGAFWCAKRHLDPYQENTQNRVCLCRRDADLRVVMKSRNLASTPSVGTIKVRALNGGAYFGSE